MSLNLAGANPLNWGPEIEAWVKNYVLSNIYNLFYHIFSLLINGLSGLVLSVLGMVQSLTLGYIQTISGIGASFLGGLFAPVFIVILILLLVMVFMALDILSGVIK
jgi:hypothetical protein